MEKRLSETSESLKAAESSRKDLESRLEQLNIDLKTKSKELSDLNNASERSRTELEATIGDLRTKLEESKSEVTKMKDDFGKQTAEVGFFYL